MTGEEFQEKVGQFLKRYGEVNSIITSDKEENSRILPFTVTNQTQKFAVFAYKWNKSIGSDVLIRLEHKVTDMACDGAIVIGNKFSMNAQDMIEDLNRRGKRKMILIKLTEMDEILDKAGR